LFLIGLFRPTEALMDSAREFGAVLDDVPRMAVAGLSDDDAVEGRLPGQPDGHPVTRF